MKHIVPHFAAKRNFWPWLFAAGALIRLLCVLALRNLHKFHGAQAGADAIEFNGIAMHVVRYHEFSYRLGQPTSFRAPGFPLWLAGLYSVSYENYVLGYLSQCVLGGLGCVLSYLLAKELLPEKEARLSGILAVLYFPAIYLCTVFLSETLFADLFALTLLLFLKYLRTSRALFAGLAGFTLGFAALTRPFGQLMLPALLCVATLAMVRKRRSAPFSAVVFCLPFLLVMSPWVWRNYLVHHKFVTVATNGGSTFYGSNNDIVLHNPEVMGRWVSTGQLPFRSLIDATPDEVSHDRLEQKLGEDWVRHHLSAMPRLEAYKAVRLWLPDFTSHNRNFVIVETVLFLPYLLFFFSGLARCLRNRSYWNLRWCTLHFTLVALMMTALIFNGDPRYRDGIYTALMPYAALGLTRLRVRVGLSDGAQGVRRSDQTPLGELHATKS